MARPIKETPVLYGRDARKFLADKKKNEGKREDPATRKRMIENFNKFIIVENP